MKVVRRFGAYPRLIAFVLVGTVLIDGLSCKSVTGIATQDQEKLILAYFDVLKMPDGYLQLDSNSRFVRKVLAGTSYTTDDWFDSLTYDPHFWLIFVREQRKYLNMLDLTHPWKEEPYKDDPELRRRMGH